MKLAIWGVTALLLSGCTTTPVKVSKAKPIPQLRILGQPAVTSKTPAKIIIVRDSGFVGSGMTILFKIDGKQTAKFATSEKAEFQIDPGSHILAVDCWTCTPVEIETILKDNETAYYRISIPNVITIQRSAEIAD